MRLKPFILVLTALALVGVLALACGDSNSDAGSASDSGSSSLEALAARLANGDDAGGISVSGQGIAVAAPDIASLSLGVSTVRDSARQARDDAASLVTELIASLEENGIAEEDYHTSRFSIDPEIDFRPSGEQVIRGYRVTSILAVTVRDLDRVGEVIDDAVDAVGDPIRVQGVTFSIEDAAALQSEARALAMADAKTKAEELAALAEVDLGKPIAISESSGGGPPPVFFGAAQLAQDVETPISPGQLEITVSVQVSYAID
ncbi:MAG: SIMPL domain-containing protein [Chloroflexi bacterium]|nr:SIMPL domain-containing protein [Chloroflexota bacterium]